MMVTKSQGLGFFGAGLILLLGIWLFAGNPNPGNLHYTSLAFLCVGFALFVGSLTSLLNEHYHRTWLLAFGLTIALLLFLFGLIFALWSYFY